LRAPATHRNGAGKTGALYTSASRGRQVGGLICNFWILKLIFKGQGLAQSLHRCGALRTRISQPEAI